MARKPRDHTADLAASRQRTEAILAEHKNELHNLVEGTGASALGFPALAGLLIAAVEQSKSNPDAVARWTERGEKFLRADRKRGRTSGNAGAAPAPEAAGDGRAAPPPHRAAE